MSIFPENVSTYGQEIDHLFFLIAVFVIIALVISVFALVYPIIRYNHKRSPRATYFTGEKKSHFRWITAALFLLAMSDFVILLAEHGAWDQIEIDPPSNALHFGVTGRQWNWIYTYPGPDGKLGTSDDVVVDSLNSELHVPVNTNIAVDLKATDVLHSLYLVNARLKQDCIPGRTNMRWFNITKEGRYDLACAEICGMYHSRMRNFIVVESKEKYEQYIKDLYAKNAPK